MVQVKLLACISWNKANFFDALPLSAAVFSAASHAACFITSLQRKLKFQETLRSRFSVNFPILSW